MKQGAVPVQLHYSSSAPDRSRSVVGAEPHPSYHSTRAGTLPGCNPVTDKQGGVSGSNTGLQI